MAKMQNADVGGAKAQVEEGQGTFKKDPDLLARTFKRVARSGQQDGFWHFAFCNRLDSLFPIQHDDDRGEARAWRKCKKQMWGSLGPC